MLAYAQGVYDTIKFVHALAAIAWLGGGIMLQVQATRLARANEPTKLAAFAKDIEFLGLRLMTPASVVVALAAVALVLYSPQWGFADTWILIGIGGYVATLITGAGFLGPESGRISKLVKTEGPESPEAQRRIRRIFMVSRVDLVVLVIVVADMVFKPGA